MNKTKHFLDTAAAAYYAGSPIISDEVFDRLADSSGYANVGAKQHEHLHKHYHRMYSLQKFYEDEGVAPLSEYKDKVSSVKLDGAAVSLLYINGALTQVLTRGDGVQGTDITSKFIARKDLVPLLIETKGIVQITGEIVAPKEVENSRNYASGALNLKDDAEFCTRGISFFAYSVYPYIKSTYREDMLCLSLLGFETVFAEDLLAIYECDGIVHRINNNTTFDSLGHTAKAPRGAYALKVRKEAVETELLAVEWQVAKSGKVTPVAILKPVYIEDKLVSRATLNNPEFIEVLELYIGCTVGIILGGEVIPKLLYKAH